jgi:hypothetical protein
MAVVVLGVIAFALGGALSLPPSRELVIKLGTLVDMARRVQPERFATQLEAVNPFVGSAFKHNRIKGILRADLSGFGEVCERLQREARTLDRRAHLGAIPVLAYLAFVGVWYAVQR